MAPDERLLSVAEIARKLGVPESTVHYWKNRFAQHLPSAGVGRQKRFRPQAVEVFRVIAEMFSTGHSAQDVIEALGKSFPLTASVDQTATEPGRGAPRQGARDAQSPNADMSDMAETAVRMAAVIAKEMGAEIARSIGEGLGRLALGGVQGSGAPALPEDSSGQSAVDTEALDAIKCAMEDTCGKLDTQADAVARVAAENLELKTKLSVLESELVRLRKDRRELEKYLLDKIKNVST